MIRGIRHTGLVVQDLEAALRLWRDGLGFKLVRQMEEHGPHMDAIMGLSGVHVTTAKLAAPDGRMVELLRFHSHPGEPTWNGGPESTGFTHIALTVGDLDGLRRHLEPYGVIFTSEAQFSPDGAVKLAYARAPDGVLLELVEELRQ